MKNRKRMIKCAAVMLVVLLMLFSMTSCGLLRALLSDEESVQQNHATSGAAATDGTSPVPVEPPHDIVLPAADTGAKSATVMVYMNGSDLESNDGSATEDLNEMIDSGVGKNVNVIVQTMGTNEWQNDLISPDTAQTWKVEDGGLTLLRDDLGKIDCTKKETLSEFIKYCSTMYPADRYLLIFWDHGGGPVYGFGVNEWLGEDTEEALTLDEMADAFAEHPELHFDMIGMDCCIMASLETCYAFAPYCDYTVLSEDFESGLGWSYTEWMEPFEKSPGMTTPVLGKTIIDSMVQENELNEYGDSTCMGLFKESAAKQLLTDWITYAYQNEDTLLATNFSKLHTAKKGGRSGGWDEWSEDASDVTVDEFYINDILAIVESVDNKSEVANALVKSLKNCVVYSGHTTDKNELTGLAISLPYGEEYFYDEMRDVYGALGIDEDYIDWLGQFVSSSDVDNYYDYDNFENSWEGWECIEEEGCETYDEMDDWTYDYEDGLWYLYEDGVLYYYDEESDTYGYYDDTEEMYYYYDESEDCWYEY